MGLKNRVKISSESDRANNYSPEGPHMPPERDKLRLDGSIGRLHCVGSHICNIPLGLRRKCLPKAPGTQEEARLEREIRTRLFALTINVRPIILYEISLWYEEVNWMRPQIVILYLYIADLSVVLVTCRKGFVQLIRCYRLLLSTVSTIQLIDSIFPGLLGEKGKRILNNMSFLFWTIVRLHI